MRPFDNKLWIHRDLPVGGLLGKPLLHRSLRYERPQNRGLNLTTERQRKENSFVKKVAEHIQLM